MQAFQHIMDNMDDPGGAVLVQEWVRGGRELVVGLTRDIQFGPCVMFGLGGIFTEILEDTVFRVAPIEKVDALEMMKEIRGNKILEAVRGMPAANLEKLAEILVTVGKHRHGKRRHSGDRHEPGGPLGERARRGGRAGGAQGILRNNEQ